MSKSLSIILCAFAAALLLVGCQGEKCPGPVGCPCDEKQACDASHTCKGGVCVAASAGDGPAGFDGGGQDEPQRCEAGSRSCRCLTSGGCQPGLRCERGICQTCPEGTAGCACKGGKSCGQGLKCEAGVCRGCQGKEGCACYANNSCDAGHTCVLGAKGQSRCEPCKGELRCGCESDGQCSATLVCLNKRCAASAALANIPKDPKCYTPCQGNLRSSQGKIQLCDPKHRLMEGCLPGFTCLSGSCIATGKNESVELSGKAYPFCMTGSDCPSWQACIEGRCYSNCKGDGDCKDGKTCHAYVCRSKCQLTKAQCPAGESCQNVGSTQDEGLCMPVARRRDDASSRPQTHEVFTLTGRELRLNNREAQGFVAITNKSAFTATFELARHSDDTGAKKPLSWVSFDVCKSYNDDRSLCTAFANKPSSAEPFALEIKAGQKVILKLLGAEKSPKAQSHYTGLFEVRTGQTAQKIHLRYRRSGTGRWKGKLYSFANFNDDGIAKIRDKNVDVRSLKNALLRRWINFKRGEISYAQFSALLQAIRENTWQQPQNQSACQKLFSAVASPDVACYPSSSSKGYDILSYSQREVPVPTGVSSLDFGIAVREQPGDLWKGRINTSETLHFPGNPQIQIGFDGTPGELALGPLKSLQATSDLGGRYRVSDKQACLGDGQKLTIPWLVPGFELGTWPRAGSLFRERYACRSTGSPWSVPAGATDKQKAAILATNSSLSAANPIPNGRVLRRSLSLVDGALLQNRVLFAIVKETFTSPFAAASGAPSALTQQWSRYGYLWLSFTDDKVSADDLKGSAPSSCASCGAGQTCQSGVCQLPSQLKQVSCSPDIVKAATQTTLSSHAALQQWSATALTGLVQALLGAQSDKAAKDPSLQILPTTKDGQVEYSYTFGGKKHYVHYFCEDTKEFNGGPSRDAKDCPVGSKVLFFSSPISEADMRGDSCQQTPGASQCHTRLLQLRTTPGFREGVPYTCADANKVFCDANRKDLREGKIFFKPSSGNTFVSSMSPLRHALFEAFRYRIKFQSRTGKNVGFTPSLCSKTAPSQTPYCYDPQVIEQIEQRVNCLEAIYADKGLSNKLSSATKASIRDFLKHAFSYSNRNVNGVLFTDPGFETLNAELKVMLGDEAYTRALGSRYDLAASQLFSFEGQHFEPNGVQLSGVLGYEMMQLYQSTQYYQSVLDRFYAQIDVFVASFQSTGAAFLSGDSVSSYFQKLLLAATRKARSWGHIAEKYHGIHRPDLAKRVLERAYVASYVEQLVLTRLLHAMAAVVDNKQLPQLRKDIERMTLTYNAALLQMQETYQKLARKLDLFGFAEGYVPFPALSRSVTGAASIDAFRYVLQHAKEKMYIAQDKEQLALHSTRSFDTDAARFQSELVKLETNYNEQLIQLCGQLKQGDRPVPAIPKNAHLLTGGAKLKDPCGRIEGSALYNAYANLERVALEAAQLEQQRQAMIQRIDDEEKRIQKFCDDRFSLAQITWDYQDQKKSILNSKTTATLLQQQATRLGMGMMEIAQGWKCELLFGGAVSSSCIGAHISNPIRIAALLGEVAAVSALSVMINDNKGELLKLQSDFAKVNVQTSCNICPPDEPNCSTQGIARIESQVRLTQLIMELQSFKLRALNAQYNMRLALSQIEGIKQRVQRLLQEQGDSVAMLQDVTAARNDPNARIYKNDAMLNAERTFHEALKEAYRATLVYEYYTSQSYARKGELYLVRMVGKGDHNLESYLSRLERAFLDFEERNGRPDTRVLVLSLRDDILAIPRIDADGNALTLQARIDLLKKALNDPKNYDADGFFRVSFSLAVDAKSPHVSPVTFNHKVSHIEAEINATEQGDDVGRVYVRQSGTGMIRRDKDTLKYYTLPTRTGVINAFFNGHKAFDPALYRNYRLQDRPLGNTQWSLLFNQASEKANQDIELNSINDITLYIYYTDFSRP